MNLVASHMYVLLWITSVESGLTSVKGYRGAAVGKGRQLAKTELEKLKFSELTMREAVMEAARM